jgi:hypothetical protein
MPFTVSPGTYQGGEFLYGGLSGLGKGIGDAFQKVQQAQADETADSLIVKHALDTGQLTADQYADFKNGSRAQKNGIVAGLARNFAMDLAQQNLETQKATRAAQEESRLASAELRRQQAAAFNWTPDEAAKQVARWAGTELVQVGPGKFQPVPYGDVAGSDQPVSARRLKDDAGRSLPYVAISKPGSNAFQIRPDLPGGFEIDPSGLTNEIGTRDANNVWRPVKASDKMFIERKDQPPPPAPQPSILSRAYQAVFGGGTPATPTPTPSATLTATPNPLGVADSYGVTLGPQDQQALAWARSNPGDADTTARAQAVKVLQDNGKPVTEANIQYVIKRLPGASARATNE